MSNETPKPSTEKTKSAHSKRISGWLIAGVAVALFAILAPFIFRQLPTTTLAVNNHRYVLEVASSETDRERGLGGRATMPNDHGMLFVFDTAQHTCFWMKDMQFNLDIIWLDASRRVLHIEPNLSPSSYPHQTCVDNDSKYVVELKAGQAEVAGLKVGQQLEFR